MKRALKWLRFFFTGELRRVRATFWGLFVLSLVLVSLDPLLGGQTWLALFGMALCIGATVFRYFYWTCPCCGAFLGRSDSVPNYCKHCGADLRDVK